MISLFSIIFVPANIEDVGRENHGRSGSVLRLRNSRTKSIALATTQKKKVCILDEDVWYCLKDGDNIKIQSLSNF